MGEDIPPLVIPISFFSKLNDALLTSIFMINTEHKTRFVVTPNYRVCDPDEALPLTTARRTSQVRQRWRKVILQSPLIWGSVVDLDLLVQKKDYWRKEVMKRIGCAPLCISGYVNWLAYRPRHFFRSLLVEHWERIRKLDVDLKTFSTGGSPNIVEKLKKRPAPNLEFILAICSRSLGNSQLPAYYGSRPYAGKKPKGGNFAMFCPVFPSHLHAL